MKLDYGKPLAGSQVLLKGEHRVELHIGRLNEELFALLMFSGAQDGLADKSKQQGPFHSKDQAVAALSAISNELKIIDYQLIQEPLIWQIQAQSELRDMRTERLENEVDTSFTPLGVPPEEPKN